MELLLSDPQDAIVSSTKERNLFLAGIGCFSGETLIRTITGCKPIKDISKGEFVLSVNLNTGKSEFRKVLEKYCYCPNDISKRIVTFNLNNVTIKCTENHEFYFRFRWIQAIEFTKRKLEISSEVQSMVLHKRFGAVANCELEKHTANGNYETSNGRQWIFKNGINNKSETINNKTSPISSTGVYSKSREQTLCQSYKFRQVGQHGGKFGVGNVEGKRESFLQQWQVHKVSSFESTKGFGGRNFEVDRTNGFGNSPKVQKENLRGNRTFESLQCSLGNNKQSSEKTLHGLEARCITLDEIQSFEISEQTENVYDLNVEHNNNYCITTENILVHNSGKSFSISLLSADYAIHNPEAIQFIGANTYSQLTKSTLKRVFDSWRTNYGWIKDIHYKVDRKPLASWPTIHGGLKSYENTICFNNGALIFTSSLDNYKAIDGSEFAIAFLDETKDTKEEAVKEVIIGRLRQAGLWIAANDELLTNQKEVDARRLNGEIIRGFNPLYIFTSPAKVPWLNEWFGLQEDYDEIEVHLYDEGKFFKKETERQCVVISSTFHNKHNLSDGYIESLMDDFKGSPHLVDMLIYGSPIAKTGGEFYHAYERSKHVKPCRYNPDLPLHITFDFNVKPYITSLIWQIEMIENRYKVRCIKSFCLKAPKNNAEDLSETILNFYSEHKEGVFIYGDATGKNTSSVTR